MFRNSQSVERSKNQQIIIFGCNWTGKLAGNYTFMLNTKIGIINDRRFTGPNPLDCTVSLNVTFSNVRVPLLRQSGLTSDNTRQVLRNNFCFKNKYENCILERNLAIPLSAILLLIIKQCDLIDSFKSSMNDQEEKNTRNNQ